MGIAIRFNLPLPGPGWSAKTLFPDREAIFKAAAMEVPELGAKFSGPFLRDPKPSLFRQSFKAGYDADKFSMSIVNIANKSGKSYAKFVRLAKSIRESVGAPVASLHRGAGLSESETNDNDAAFLEAARGE